MKYPSLKNLACISGFNTIGESQPHGTNHAGAAALAAIVAADTFDTVDLFAEVAPKAGLLGERRAELRFQPPKEQKSGCWKAQSCTTRIPNIHLSSH